MDDEVDEPVSMFDGQWCGLCQRRFDAKNNLRGYTRCPLCAERATWAIEEELHMTTRELELRDSKVGRLVEINRKWFNKKLPPGFRLEG